MTALSLLKHSRVRRTILLAAGGLALGAMIVTVYGAAPRPVDIVVTVQEAALENRRSSLIILSEGATVAEVDSGRGTIETGRLNYRFWLTPQLHRLELRIEGCPPEVRTFTPGKDHLVAFAYRCRRGD